MSGRNFIETKTTCWGSYGCVISLGAADVLKESEVARSMPFNTRTQAELHLGLERREGSPMEKVILQEGSQLRGISPFLKSRRIST